MPSRVLRRVWWNELDWGTVLIVLSFIAVVLFGAYNLYQDSEKQKETRKALCYLRHAREVRVEEQYKFLALSEQERIIRYGPIGKIEDEVILNGIAVEEVTINALSFLECGDFEPYSDFDTRPVTSP